jgi:cytochrome c553
LNRGEVTAIRDYLINRAQQEDTKPRAAGSRPGDAQRGAKIVAQGTAAGAPACAQCHAFSGGSDSSGAFPRIAGQPAAYLERQLTDFRSGARNNAIMTPIARALSTNDALDVAAYFADIETPFPPLAPPDPQLVAEGKKLAESGDSTRGIPGCPACHGTGGTGAAPTIPYLAGQYAHYTAFQLEMWRRGFRRNSSEAMGLFAGLLTEHEIQAVSAYYQQARPAALAAQSK